MVDRREPHAGQIMWLSPEDIGPLLSLESRNGHPPNIPILPRGCPRLNLVSEGFPEGNSDWHPDASLVGAPAGFL